MAALLAELGVPHGQITLEETATDTLSSALACARLLAGETRAGARSLQRLPSAALPVADADGGRAGHAVSATAAASLAMVLAAAGNGGLAV